MKEQAEENPIILLDGLYPQRLNDFLDSARGRIFMEEQEKARYVVTYIHGGGNMAEQAQKLNVYVCTHRGQPGAFIVAAPNTVVALGVGWTGPYNALDREAIQIPDVEAAGDPRVLYHIRYGGSMMGNLNVYECRRSAYDSSMGASIFAAQDTHQVNELYSIEFPWRPLPMLIIQWQDVTATGQPRVLYNGDIG